MYACQAAMAGSESGANRCWRLARHMAVDAAWLFDVLAAYTDVLRLPIVNVYVPIQAYDRNFHNFYDECISS